MKKLYLLGLVLALPSLVQALPNSGDFGAGIVIGDATGPTIKYFTSKTTALDVGLGFDSDFDIYADYVWHGWNIIPRPEKGAIGLTFGMGPRFEEQDHHDDKFGVRTVGGIEYWVQEIPLEIFLEVGPWFVFSPDTDTEMDVGLGARFYF